MEARDASQSHRSLARRADRGKTLEVNGQGALQDRAGRWHPEEPNDMPKDGIGGSAATNAFLGEERFLQEAADHTDKVQEQQSRQAAWTQAAADISNHPPASLNDIATDISNLLATGSSDEPYDLDLETNTAHIAKAASSQNVFAAEQPFLNKISADTGVPIRWAAHPEKCFCGQEAASNSTNDTLVIWDCNDATKADEMKFIIPPDMTPEQGPGLTQAGHGQIQWAKDPTKCIYVRNGWAGNGNPVYLWTCTDTPSFQAMNFSVFTPATSGLSSIAWTKEPSTYPTHCLDVHNLGTNNGNPIELWDCSAGTMWKLY